MTIPIDRRIYDEHGLPQSWRDVNVAWLNDIVQRYRDGYPLDADELAGLLDFFEYWTAAPAWRSDDVSDATRLMAPKLAGALRAVHDQGHLCAWRNAARVVDLDPLFGLEVSRL